jgi:hypothetical protein
MAAPRDEAGGLLLPANVPYCEEHALLYPPSARRCQVDGADLTIACPVDGTARAADITTCTSCGTTYLLGKGSRAVVVAPAGGPPAGGAAVA